MNKQNFPQPDKSIQRLKHIWIAIIAVVITAIIISGGVYAWQNSNLKLTEQSFQEQITLLQNQINQLQQAQQNQNQQIVQPAAKDDSQNLKTYTNSNYKFSFQYPTDFQYKEYPPFTNYGGVLNLAIGDNFTNQQEAIDNDIFISVMKNYPADNPLSIPNGMDPDPRLTEELMIDGIEAKKYVSGGISYVMVNDGLRYEFFVSDKTAQIAKDLETVINSFKFTK